MLQQKKLLRVLVDQGFNQAYNNFLSTKYNVEIIEYKKDEKGYYPKVSNIDLVLFTGGEDVDPSIYGQEKGKNTFINEKRDDIEQDMFRRYSNISKLGICRGAQFLNVMSGGSLIQHVTGHLGNHSIHFKHSVKDFYNNRNNLVGYEITSTHHQMMFPFNLKEKEYDLLAWSNKFKSKTYLNGLNEEINLPKNFLEPEVVYYPETYSLCIQGHPEMSNCPSNTVLLLLNLIEKKLLNQEKLINQEEYE